MIVDFDSGTWLEPWFMDLSVTGKMLYIYLYANDHKNLIGLYRLSIKIMAFETGIPANKIEAELKSLFPKVKYDDKKNVVWVVDLFKEQFMKNGKLSPKILPRATRNILSMTPHPFIEEFIEQHDYEHLCQIVTNTV